MRCAPVIVLFASSTVSQGIQQLEDVADGRQVVVVREHDGEFYYYVFMVGAVRLRLVAAISPDLASALHLDELPPAATGQLSGTPPPVGGVVLEGREVVGVIVGDPDEGHGSATRGRIALPRLQPTREAGINFGQDVDDHAVTGEGTLDRAPDDRVQNSPPTEEPAIQAAWPPPIDADSREFSRPRQSPPVRGIFPRPTPGAVPGPTQLPDDRTVQPESPESPEPRRVRADVFFDGDAVSRDAFVRGQRHQVQVWIGHNREAKPNTITASSLFPEDAVTPDRGPSTELQVTMSDGGQVQSASLSLPNDRELSSKPCTFDLAIATDQAEVSAMIIVGQNGRTLQQLRLTGKTVGSSKDRAGEDEITLITEVEARPLDGAATATLIDASVHSSSAGGPPVVIQDGKASIAAPWDENIRPTVNDIAAKIYEAGRAAATGDGEPEWLELIRLLAAKGAQLHSWLMNTEGYDRLASAQRIQLVDADATRPLPIELVYDGARIAKTAVPCPNWDQALASGHCEHCANATSAEDAKNPPPFWSPAICPLGFWGLTKVIERQTGLNAATPGRLDLLSSVMFAASDNVRQNDYDATVEVLTEVGGQPPALATAWEQWPQLVTEHRPTLIVALPHQDRDPEWNMDYLEIGAASQLFSGQVMNMLQTDALPLRPVVLLLGCRTGNAKATFQNFVGEFRTAGAPIVLGTIATVLGRDAAAIAQEFVRELAAAGGGGGEILFGEAMRAVRRLMIAKKKAAALGLIAFGDSDWRVEVRV
jgi:hypothetical protein